MGALAGLARNCSHDAANALRLLRRNQGDQPALAVPSDPDARASGALARRIDPGVHVSGIFGHRDVVAVGHRGGAGEHAALVDEKRPHAARGQRFGELAIGSARHAVAVVAVTVGWP